MSQAQARSRVWLGLAVLLLAALVLAALWSPDRQQPLQAFQAAGPLRELPADRVAAITLRQGGRQWRAERTAQGWVLTPAPAPPAAAAHIDAAVNLLRNAAVERELQAVAPEFGLGESALEVRIYAAGAGPGPAFEFRFGAANPIGLARYAQVRAGDGAVQTLLLPAYVADAWEQVIGLR